MTGSWPRLSRLSSVLWLSLEAKKQTQRCSAVMTNEAGSGCEVVVVVVGRWGMVPINDPTVPLPWVHEFCFHSLNTCGHPLAIRISSYTR